MPNIRESLKRILASFDSELLQMRPDAFYERLVFEYMNKVLGDLNVIQESEEGSDIHSRLIDYLASNWSFIQNTYLSYTSLADNEITRLLSELALLLSSKEVSALEILLPGVCLEPINSVNYPTFYQGIDTIEQIIQILKTHIVGDDGISLIPVAVLYKEDILEEKSLPTIYFDVFNERYQAQEEGAFLAATVSEGELDRLYNHSEETQNLLESKNHYLSLINDKSTLLGQLTMFLKSLYYHSVNIIGTETEAGIGIYTASQDFFLYYDLIDTVKLEKLPKPLIQELSLLRQYFSGERKADIGSCFATRHEAIRREMKGCEVELSNISFGEKEKDDAVKMAKERFEERLLILEAALEAPQDSYVGMDKLGVNQSILENLNMEMIFQNYEHVLDLIKWLKVEDIPHVFQNQNTQVSFFNEVNTFKRLNWLIIDMPTYMLKVLFSSLNQVKLENILMRNLKEFYAFYEMLSDEKKSVILSSALSFKSCNITNLLLNAIKSGMLDFASILIDAGVDPNIQDNDGNTPLIFAAALDHKKITFALIQAGANLQVKNADGGTALMFASLNGWKEITFALIQAGAELELQTIKKNTALMLAANCGKCEVLSALLTEGANCDVQNEDGNTALMLAVQSDKCEVLSALLTEGANCDVQNRDGNTALMLAVQSGKFEIFSALLTKGANCDVQNRDGNTALMLAVQSGKFEIFSALLTKGANRDVQNKDGNTALMLAVQSGKFEIFSALLTKGANRDVLNGDGNSALMLAVKNGFHEIVLALIKAGANLDLENKDGDTAFMHAVKKGDTKTVNIIIVLGRGHELKIKNGTSPLMVASKIGHVEIINLLIKSGVPLDVINDEGNTALMIATKHEQQAIAIILINRGANFEIDNQQGKSVLMIAAEQGLKAIVQVLIKHNANTAKENQDGNTAVMIANNQGHEEIVQAILNKNEYFLMKGRSLLLEALADRDRFLASALIEAGEDVDTINYWGSSSLLLAIDRGYEEIALLIIERTTRLETGDLIERIPLHRACAKGHNKVVSALIKRGVKLDEVKSGGFIENGHNGQEEYTGLYTPIRHAERAHNGDAIIMLLKAGVPIESLEMSPHELLADAIMYHQTNLALWLIELYPHFKHSRMPEYISRVPLFYALEKGHVAFAVALAKSGVSLSELTNEYSGIPTWEVFCQHKEVIDIFVSNSEKFDGLDGEGMTLLDCARRYNYPDVVQMLNDANERALNDNIQAMDDIPQIEVASFQVTVMHGLGRLGFFEDLTTQSEINSLHSSQPSV